MLQGKPIQTSSPGIPDIVRQTAVVIASVSIALAAISLTLLAVADSNLLGDSLTLLPVRIALSIIGLVFVYASALIIDWLVDNFSDEDWQRVFEIDQNPNIIKNDPNKWDQIPSRLRLFGGGYAAFCFCVSVISFSIVSLAPVRLQLNIPLLHSVLVPLNWKDGIRTGSKP